MSLPSLRPAHLLHVPLAVIALASLASAQVALSGNVFDGSGGPLLSGTVYHAASITVPAGQTLTVQAGAVVKFNPGQRWTVDGTLDVDGIEGSKAFLTSLSDDSVGGDTNGDGPSVGMPGDWQGIVVSGAGVLDVDQASIRFAGAANLAPVFAISTGSITVRNTVMSDSTGSGMNLNGTTIPVVVENCTLDNNGLFPIAGAHIDALGTFLDNTASGNGSGDVIQFTVTSPTVSLTVDRSRLLNDCLFLVGSCTVPVGLTLTIDEGVVVKWVGVHRLTADGDVVIDGTPSEPVVMTTSNDDEYLGDTTNNGPTSGAPGDWQGIVVTASGSLTVDNATLRYCGGGGVAPVFGVGGAISVRDSVLREASGAAINMNSYGTASTISGCTFQDNGGIALFSVHIDSVPGFSNNTAVGNGGDYIYLTNPSPTTDKTITLDNLLGNVLVSTTSTTIPSGTTLTLAPGMVWKWVSVARLTCDGTLVAKGTETNRIVFTSFVDDDFAGDTNNDGPSNGAPGNWQGILVRGSGALELHDAVLRYCGGGGLAPVFVSGGDIDVRRCRLWEASGPGINMGGQPGPVTFVENRIEDNGGPAVTQVAASSIPGFEYNVGSGNAGDYMLVTTPSPTADLEIARHNLIGDLIVAANSLTVPSGVTLTVKEGVVFKWTGTFRFTVDGTAELLGTGLDPIVFTSFLDDSVLGDSNGDGNASSPSPASWQGFLLNVQAANSRFEHMRVKYTGAGALPGVWNFSPTTSLRSVRADHCANDGFRLAAGTSFVNLIAFEGDMDGFELTGGSADLLHATATGNTGFGIRYVAPYSGQIHNTISWNNGAGNYTGVAAGSLTSSDGDAVLAGSDGNLNVDPLFVDPSATVGDLRLATGSPVIDAAATIHALAVRRDHSEHSRSLDPTLSGTLRPDMGAHETGLWELSLVAGEPRLGSFMEFEVDGPAGTCTYMLGLRDGSSYVPPFGFITCGGNSVRIIGMAPVGETFRIPVPSRRTLEGTRFGVQALVTPTGSTSTGAISNLYRACLLPREEDGKKKHSAAPGISGTVEKTL